jgi:hypothetical protein
MTNDNQNSIYMVHDLDASEEPSTDLPQLLVSKSIQGLIYLFSGIAIAVNFFGSHFLD